MLHLYLESSCGIVRANNSTMHFLKLAKAVGTHRATGQRWDETELQEKYKTPVKSPLQFIDKWSLYLGPGLEEGSSVMSITAISDLPWSHFCVLGPDLPPGREGEEASLQVVSLERCKHCGDQQTAHISPVGAWLCWVFFTLPANSEPSQESCKKRRNFIPHHPKSCGPTLK